MGKDVIIALDFSRAIEAFEFVCMFKDCRPYVKIGMELYYSEGPGITQMFKAHGHNVFLDLKLHDIPNTVSKTMQRIGEFSIDMLDMHAAGGIEMMKAGRKALGDGVRPLAVGVTQLTSISEEAMHNELGIPGSVNDIVVKYALNAKAAGLDGVVCSPFEAKAVKEACGSEFLTITPGVRFADDSNADQKRVATPEMAKQYSDYIVVGRPITRAKDPVEAYKRYRKAFVD